MKVRFENNGDLVAVNHGRVRFEVPKGAGEQATILPLEDTEEVRRVLSYLTAKHQTLSIILIDELKEEGGKEPSSDSNENVGGESDNDEEPLTGNEDKADGEGASDENTGDGKKEEKLSFDAFKLRVEEVTKGLAGWWTVKISGLQNPVKVRSAESEEDAMRLAYEDFVEDFS